MNAFSAGYFLRENKKRCGLLIFMFVLTYIAYLGGLYATNIRSMYEYSIERLEKYTTVYGGLEEEEQKNFKDAIQQVMEDERLTVLKQGVISSLHNDNIMSFQNNFPSYAFRSVEDFQCYCAYMGIQCDFDNLKEGSFIASQMMVNDRGMCVGDKLAEEENERVYGEYTLDAITDEPGYTSYFINSEENYNCMVLPTGMSLEEFDTYIWDLVETYDVAISDADVYRENLDEQLVGFHYIYILIVVLLAIVMAVTINAAFVGMYQHRQAEFSVYLAIGIPKRRIVGKVAKELLLIDGIGLVVGAVILFVGLYLLNELCLIPQGLQLFYYHPMALGGLVLCNLTVLLPLLFTRCRQLLRADICNY